MAVIQRRKPPEEAEIPTASMADIAFLLIVFFMVTTVFARDKGLKILLPEKGQKAVVSKGKVIEVSINDQGTLFLGDQQVTMAQLKSGILQELAKKPDKVVVIKTNIDAPYERMINVFDVVKQIPQVKAVSIASIRPG